MEIINNNKRRRVAIKQENIACSFNDLQKWAKAVPKLWQIQNYKVGSSEKTPVVSFSLPDMSVSLPPWVDTTCEQLNQLAVQKQSQIIKVENAIMDWLLIIMVRVGKVVREKCTKSEIEGEEAKFDFNCLLKDEAWLSKEIFQQFSKVDNGPLLPLPKKQLQQCDIPDDEIWGSVNGQQLTGRDIKSVFPGQNFTVKLLDAILFILKQEKGITVFPIIDNKGRFMLLQQINKGQFEIFDPSRNGGTVQKSHQSLLKKIPTLFIQQKTIKYVDATNYFPLNPNPIESGPLVCLYYEMITQRSPVSMKLDLVRARYFRDLQKSQINK